MMRRWSVIAVVIVVIVAASSAGVLLLRSGGAEGGRPIADGPTLYEALAEANSSVSAVSGGPWTLFEALGVASPVPTYPSSWGWGPYDHVLASCQSAFNGLTIWNGTIPLFDGSFDSGTAPFWEFFFFSNASQQITTVTNVLGTPHAYPPILMSSPCAVASMLGYEPWRSAWAFDRGPFPGDSPALASGAWSAVAEKYVAWVGSDLTEMYLFGDLQVGSGQPIGNQITFFQCGTPGAGGVTRGLDVFAGTVGSPQGAEWANYTIGCTPTTNDFTAIPLTLVFGNTTLEGGTDSTILAQEFQIRLAGAPPYSGPGYNSRGLTTWMVGLNLENSSGAALPLGASGCAGWVSSIRQCVGDADAWYAVLLSPDGSWEGSYGSNVTGPGWTWPVLPIANNETLAILLPASWSTSGYSLELSSTTDLVPMSGSVQLS